MAKHQHVLHRCLRQCFEGKKKILLFTIAITFHNIQQSLEISKRTGGSVKRVAIT